MAEADVAPPPGRGSDLRPVCFPTPGRLDSAEVAEPPNRTPCEDFPNNSQMTHLPFLLARQRLDPPILWCLALFPAFAGAAAFALTAAASQRLAPRQALLPSSGTKPGACLANGWSWDTPPPVF